MDPLMAIAASGLRARMESLDLMANNAANSSTSGFKADREFYSLYVSPEAQDAGSTTTMPLIENRWTDLAQGTLRTTGNSLDLAISGTGFFTVEGPTGVGLARTPSGGDVHFVEANAMKGKGGFTMTGQIGQVMQESMQAALTWVRSNADRLGVA